MIARHIAGLRRWLSAVCLAMLCLAALCLAALWPLAARAAAAEDTVADTALEARVNQVAAELRCLVCQNQNLADSHAGLAVDLKNQVREQLRAGRSPQQVIDYMTERYGDFVRYRPPFKPSTWLLWLGPLLLVMGGLVGLWRALGRQARAVNLAGNAAPGVPADADADAEAAAAQAGTPACAPRDTDPASARAQALLLGQDA